MTAAWWILLASLGAGNEPNPYLAQAKVFYQGVDYENCLKRLEQAVRWNNTRPELVEIEIYWGLCQFEDAQRTASRHFALALQLDPAVQLPPFTSPKVVEVFKSVAAKVPHPPEPPPPEPPHHEDAPKVVALAPVEPPPPAIVAPPPKPGRHVGPPTLALGVAAMAAVGTGIGFGLAAKQNETSANGAYFTSDAAGFASAAQFDAGASNVAYGVAAACAVAAVVVYLLSGPKEGS